MIKRILPYYKKNIKLFILDMICATLVSVCDLFYPTLTRKIINVYIPNRQLNAFVIWIVVLLAIFSLKAILNYIIGFYGHMVGVRIQGDLRNDLFKHLQKLPIPYYDDNKVGQIMSRLVNDLFEVAELCHHGPEDIILSLLTLIGSMLMIGTISWWLTLIVACILPLMALIIISTRKDMLYAMKLSRERTADINSDVENSLLGIKVTKGYTAETHEEAKFSKSNDAFMLAKRKGYKVLGKFTSLITYLLDAFYLVALLSGGLFFYYGKIDVGDLTAYILYISATFTPIRRITTIYEELQNGISGFSRFIEIMDIPEESEPSSSKKLDAKHGDVVFNNITFSYKKGGNGESAIIKDLNLTVKCGKTLALVGPSGGGKTTLCNLIPRFYDVDAGKITINGIDIKDVSREELRKNIAIVSQDVFLFTGTIKDNIAYGNLDATDEEIKQAGKLANIDEFASTLENGYDTYIGERGVKLSGGQRQRISIARAFLKNPPILILDEATSALDNITEMQIQQSLEKLSSGRTTIVVAHRLSTIKNSDEIVVVTGDGILEKGTHDELIKNNGLYAELYNYQFKTN